MCYPYMPLYEIHQPEHLSTIYWWWSYREYKSGIIYLYENIIILVWKWWFFRENILKELTIVHNENSKFNDTKTLLIFK